MDRRYVIWLAPGIVIFTLALAGCQKKEEPVPAANPAPAAAPAGNSSAGAGAVATGPTGSDVGPGSSPVTEGSKAPDKQETGKKTF
jgi:hypothetical protein